MQDSSPRIKAGSVAIETLFKGSKSEDLYPVFICDDGTRYRIHVKGNESKDATLLEYLDGLSVRLVGYTDDIKGHARIVIDPDLSQSIEIIHQNSEQNNSTTPEGTSEEAKNNLENKESP